MRRNLKFVESASGICFLTGTNEESDGYGEDLDYSKDLYKETSKRLDKAYIILISFILLFFFGAVIPYTFLVHKLESTVSDDIIMNLSKLSSLILEQENVVKSIQNNIDVMRVDAINDYQGLDKYFRKLELLESKMVASSGNVSALELETITPTFLVCNEEFRLNTTEWASCNANFVADGINKKIILRLEQLPQQTIPLMVKAQNIENEFYVIANPLNKTNSRIPSGIEPVDWKVIKEEISKDMGYIHLLKLKADQVLNLTKRPAKSIVWNILGTPYRQRHCL